MSPVTQSLLCAAQMLFVSAVCGCGEPNTASETSDQTASTLPSRVGSSGAAESSGTAGRSGTAGSNETGGDCSFAGPPPIVLSASAGEQRGLTGSYCAGRCQSFVCVDSTADRGTWYTVVHPGDEVVFSMPAGTLMGGGALCNPDCPPTLYISEFCESPMTYLTSMPLQEDHAWRVSLPPGSYVLSAQSHFTGDDGSHGSTSSHFGLIVDPQRDRAIVPPSDPPAQCQHKTPLDADAGM